MSPQPPMQAMDLEEEVAAAVETSVGRWAAGGIDANHALAHLADLTVDPEAAQTAVVVLSERLCALLGDVSARLGEDPLALWAAVTSRFHDPTTGDLLPLVP